MNSAQQIFLRVLALALPDEAKRERKLREALGAAKLSELPPDPNELLQFVRAHLATALRGEVAPNLILALINDVRSELEAAEAGKAPSSSRMTVAPVAEDGVAPRAPRESDPAPRTPFADLIAKTPFPKLKESVANLVRTASTKLQAVRAPQVSVRGIRVALIESDRMLRASLARTLLGAKLEVGAFDTPSDAATELDASEEPLVAIVDVNAPEAESALRTLTKPFPRLAVVAWTEAPLPLARAILNVAGIRRFRHVPKSAGASEIVEAIRALAAELRPSEAAK
jgi:hypothetical protein